MKKIYIVCALCFLSLAFVTCSKDFLKAYEKRVVGTWKLHDVDKYGIGRSNNLPFKEDGIFTFLNDGQLTYTSGGNLYKGSWDIRKETKDDNKVNTLYVTVVDFVNQQVLTEYFNRMTFTGTDRFNAVINQPLRSYVFRFSRQ
jgi:hypothetical protein